MIIPRIYYISLKICNTNNMKQKTARIICLSCVLIAFFSVLICVLLKTDFLVKTDSAIFNFIRIFNSTFLDWLFVILSYIASSKGIILIMILLICLPNRKQVGFPVSLAVILSATINFGIKILVARARPASLFPNNLPLGYNFPSSFSFPSGHAQTGTVLFFSIAFCLCQNTKSATLKTLFITTAFALSLLTSLGRIYLGVHFFSDVFCGLLLATAVLIFAKVCYDIFFEKHINYQNNYKCANKNHTDKLS